MDERIVDFVKKLKDKLRDLPQQEIEEAVNYYEEYLNDAAEAGKDLDKVIAQLDSPDKIASKIKTETSIIKAQHSPGLKNFAIVLKNALHMASAPFSVLLISIFVVISYSIAVLLFAGAFVTLIGAVAVTLAVAYEAFTIPLRFALEAVGTLGLGFMCGSICFLVAFGLYKLARLFVRISVRTIKHIINKRGDAVSRLHQEQPQKKSHTKRLVFVCLIISFVGLLFFSVSGMPYRFITIFNSMKPENITIHTYEFAPTEFNRISLTTAHSHIKLIRSDSDKVVVSYEQPDWLDYDIDIKESMLYFYEKSNGRLPMFELIAIHESRTELIVSVPEGYSPQLISAQSKGGFVDIIGLAEDIEAKTYTGSILLDLTNIERSINIKANTSAGYIKEAGKSVGYKTKEGTEYYSGTKAEKTISLQSSRGNIIIR